MRKIGIILCGGLAIIVFVFIILEAIITKSPDDFLYEDDPDYDPDYEPEGNYDDDFGEDIDNCPTNTKELKKLTTWETKMSGTFVTVSAASTKDLLGAADVASTKITPRTDVTDADFKDIWWVGDYSDKNSGSTAGFVAIHMLNSLSTGGFSMQSSNKAKGTFAFEFTGHYSIKDIETVPFEIYVKKGE